MGTEWTTYLLLSVLSKIVLLCLSFLNPELLLILNISLYGENDCANTETQEYTKPVESDYASLV